MIRPININLNAAHPELPLVEATTFTGAPSSVFIRGVPKAVGNWSITAVSVAVTYPDNTTTARAAVESAEGVWVATIPGTATSGRTAAGFKIMADGIDENGAAVTGYVLGFSDFSVLSFTPVPAPGGTFYLLRYFDQAPATPKEGDVAVVDSLLKMYNGTAWVGFGDGPGFSTDNPQMDGSASPGSAATAARSDHVHPSDTRKPNKPDAWSINTLLTLDPYGNLVDSGKSADNVLPPSSATPAMDGTGSAGSANAYSRGDHVHPSDTSRAADDAVVKLTGNQDIGGNKTFYGDVEIADGKDFSVLGGRVAVRSQGGSDVALFEYDRLEYSTDGGMTWTSIMLDNIAPLASPAFTGTPTAPTPSSGDDSTKVATTAFVQSEKRYTLPETMTTISSASSEVISGETVYYGEATLADREQNQVLVLVALDDSPRRFGQGARLRIACWRGLGRRNGARRSRARSRRADWRDNYDAERRGRNADPCRRHNHRIGLDGALLHGNRARRVSRQGRTNTGGSIK